MTAQQVLIGYEKRLSLKQQALCKFLLWCDLTTGRFFEDGKWQQLQEAEHDIFIQYCEGLIDWTEFLKCQRMNILFNRLCAYSGGQLGWTLAQSFCVELGGTVPREYVEEMVIKLIHKYAA